MNAGRPVAPPIALSKLAVGYRGQPVLSDLDWTIASGSMTALIGPNGGGKSTLLRTLAGEIDPLSGHLSGLRRDLIAYLPQTSGFDRDFPITVHDAVAMGLWRRLGPFGRITRQDAIDLDAVMAGVGIAGLASRQIGTLSGGELQRALFARLTLLDAPVILLDEPFAGIDTDTVSTLMAHIGGWHREGRTIVAALHDLDQVRSAFPMAIRLEGNHAVAGTTPDILGVDP